MNRKEYNSDPRYAKVLEQMDLLGIMDISTTRQSNNGTIVWRLPIKDRDTGILIEVASFKTGYVRNQGKSTRSNYQLNKQRKYPPRKWSNGYEYSQTYRKLIPIEIDRLEYLISYCLKNYYIKNANLVANGDYIQKWEHENELDKVWKDGNENATSYDGWNGPNEVQLIIDGHRYKVI